MDNINKEDNLNNQEEIKEEPTKSKRGRKKQITDQKKQPLSEEKESQQDNSVVFHNSQEEPIEDFKDKELCPEDIEQMFLFLTEVLELMYWTKAKQITTPGSAEMSTELDNIFKHKTADMPKLIKDFLKDEE